MKRILLSMAAAVIAVAGLGLFATSASAHPVSCAPIRYHRAAAYRTGYWAHPIHQRHVRFEHRKPC